MAHKWTMRRSVKIPGDENIKIVSTALILEIEMETLEESHVYLKQNDAVLSEIFGTSFIARLDFGPEGKSTELGAPEPEKPARKPRTPKVDAVAPPPLPVPPAPVAPPPVTTVLPPNTLQGEGGIPPFLDRKNPEAAVHSPPPILPSPPTAPASPPPVGVLGPKVVAALEAHKTGEPGGDQKLADWLAACGLTIPGKTFDEACRVVLMTSDEKLKPIAEAFGVHA